MDTRDGFLGSIGNTKLIRLKHASDATGCEILGKAEFLNPGGSVKDRAAIAIVRDAEKRGQLRPGGVIVEGSAGNTGIGLALVGNALGYRTVIVIPETQSQEKKDMLRLCGAELREVPAKPYKNPDNYVHVSHRLADELAESVPEGAIWANQFDNVANREGHRETTGSEIWDQTGGDVDGFICAAGTGGTVAGVGLALKDSLGNFAAGVMLVMFRPFTKGDFVEVSGISGKVDEVRIFSTILTTGDNKQVIIPNGLVAADTITNYTAKDRRRVDMVFGVGYDDDLKLTRDVLTRICKEHPDVLDDPACNIFVLQLGASSVDFAVRPWAKTENYWTVWGDIHEQVKVELEAAGLSIPYPQQDVHVHKTDNA